MCDGLWTSGPSVMNYHFYIYICLPGMPGEFWKKLGWGYILHYWVLWAMSIKKLSNRRRSFHTRSRRKAEIQKGIHYKSPHRAYLMLGAMWQRDVQPLVLYVRRDTSSHLRRVARAMVSDRGKVWVCKRIASASATSPLKQTKKNQEKKTHSGFSRVERTTDTK